MKEEEHGCPNCNRRFENKLAAQQHIRHSHRCRLRARYRRQQADIKSNVPVTEDRLK